MYVTENIQFPNPPGDKLRVLGTEIEDQDRFLHIAKVSKSANQRGIIPGFIPNAVSHHQVKTVFPFGHMFINKLGEQS